MTYRTFALAFILFTTIAYAQKAPNGEYVRNGGFEFSEKVPDTYDMIDHAVGWNSVTIGFAELFSKRAPAKTVGIPENNYGKMDPQEGEHYAGFHAWKDDEKRSYNEGDDDFVAGWNSYSEYPVTELLEPLKEGKEYEISFWVALSANSDRAVSGIGAHCAQEPLHYNHRRFLNEKPQVSVDGILAEKGKWVEVKGTFEADGNERYIIIGTYPAANFDSKRVIEGLDNKYAYYYLDNVSLKEVPAEAPKP